ncbi:unnamed protein product [Closterium sp. NIES-65]|nr:unnamed protein product [Closterium sp. NIES-65]CAI6004300.1 unnamed protein product [Closterium sp. NIES-65]CAI6010077.1 unnamed protein product [Closterium sp. NIES-65]
MRRPRRLPPCTGSSCSPPNSPTAKLIPVLSSLLSVLIFPLSSQQVALTGVAVGGDMECTGSRCSPPNPPTAKLILCSPVLPTTEEGAEWLCVCTQAVAVALPFPSPPCLWRGGAGVNTDASSRPSPVAVQVPVGMGGRQHCQSLPQGRVSGWAWPLKWPLPALALQSLFSLLHSHHSSPRCPLTSSACALQVGGGAGVNTDAPSRPSRVAVQVPVVMGGRQHCQSLPQGRVSALPVAAIRESIGQHGALHGCGRKRKEAWGEGESGEAVGSMGASGQVTLSGAASSRDVPCGSGCGGWNLRGTALGAQLLGVLFPKGSGLSAAPTAGRYGGEGLGGLGGDGGDGVMVVMG